MPAYFKIPLFRPIEERALKIKSEILIKKHPITISIDDIKTSSKVGIWEHEKNSQPILISIKIEGVAPVMPDQIEECIDYEPIVNWLLNDFRRLPHTNFLETRLMEIFEYIFAQDEQIVSVMVKIYKTSAFINTKNVGIEMKLDKKTFKGIDLFSAKLLPA